MATERVPMRTIREILRLKWVAQRSHRETARSLGVSPGAVASAVSRARARTLTWEAVEALTDDALERMLYGPTAAEVDGARPEPDLAWIHQELRRPGVTLELLHVEYLVGHPTGYAPRRGLDRAVMRQLAVGRWILEHHNVLITGATVDAPASLRSDHDARSD
jgi:hypothetical protein